MLFDYLKKPFFNPIKRKISIANFLKLLLLFYILIIPCSGIVGLIKIFDILPHNRIEDIEKSWESAIYALLFAPIIEELLFRLPLRINARNLSISFSIILTVIIKLFFFHKSNYEVYFFSIPLIFFFYYFILYNKRIFQKIETAVEKLFSYFFYLIAWLFGISHLFNYEEIYWWMIIISPFLILPYFLMGIFLAHIAGIASKNS